MSGKTVQIPLEVEKFYRDTAKKSQNKLSGVGRSRMLAFTYEFDNNDFERYFERVLKMPIHVDVVTSSHRATRKPNRYNLWHANWHGTFHPKLICCMSGGELLVGLGSSNLISGGLQGNLEVWHFSKEDSFLCGVRDFLLALKRKKIVSLRVNLEEFLSLLPESSNKSVLSTLDGNLIDQVMSRLTGPIKRLDIISPIHGDPTPVVNKLKKKFGGLKICLHADSVAVPKISNISEYKYLKRPDADEQLRSIGSLHAKMYAFQSNRRIDLFWGSANFSISAWMRSDNKANVELLAHSVVDRKEWNRFIKSPFPGHKWVETKPQGVKTEIEYKAGAEWRLLNAVWDNRKLYLIASRDALSSLQLRNLGVKAVTACCLTFSNQEVLVPNNVASKLGFTAAEGPNCIEWRKPGGKWKSIPVNNLDIAPDGTHLSTLTERLYWEFSCRPLPKKTTKQTNGDMLNSDRKALPEEEELTISDHQGDFDRFVLEWRSVAKRMQLAAHGNDSLIQQYISKIKNELIKTINSEPGLWPQYKTQFIHNLIDTNIDL